MGYQIEKKLLQQMWFTQWDQLGAIEVIGHLTQKAFNNMVFNNDTTGRYAT